MAGFDDPPDAIGLFEHDSTVQHRGSAHAFNRIDQFGSMTGLKQNIAGFGLVASVRIFRRKKSTFSSAAMIHSNIVSTPLRFAHGKSLILY